MPVVLPVERGDPLGGLLGTELGLTATLWIAVAGGVAGATLLLPSPLPRFRLPAPERTGELEDAGSV